MNGEKTITSGIIAGIVLLIAAPLLIWHFLVFPNIDGMFGDVEWYLYDSMSQHYIYWTGFWILVIGFGRTALTLTK